MTLRFIFIIAAWFLLHCYVIVRLLCWGGVKFRFRLLLVAVAPAFCSFGLKLLYVMHNGQWVAWPMRVMDFWMGWLLLGTLSVMIFEVPVFLKGLKKRRAAIGALLLSVALTLTAMVLAKSLYVRYETLDANISRSVRIAHIADLHFGYMTRDHLQSVIKKVRSLKPDVVVISGDMIDHLDSEEFHKASLLEAIDARIIFTTGNHEGYAGLGDVVATLDGTKLAPLLGGRFVDIDTSGVRIYGLQDCRTKGEFAVELNSFSVNNDGSFDILSTHRPLGPELAAAKGFELMLSGHTHAGQIMPFGLIVRLSYRYFFGLYEVDGMWLNVTSGAGYWGPAMRLPRPCEIVCIDLKPVTK